MYVVLTTTSKFSPASLAKNAKVIKKLRMYSTNHFTNNFKKNNSSYRFYFIIILHTEKNNNDKLKSRNVCTQKKIIYEHSFSN